MCDDQLKIFAAEG